MAGLQLQNRAPAEIMQLYAMADAGKEAQKYRDIKRNDQCLIGVGKKGQMLSRLRLPGLYLGLSAARHPDKLRGMTSRNPIQKT